jgi:purine-binding chemotaxis protein CheW
MEGQTDSAAATCKLVTVCIGSQQFAIDIVSVREIRGWTQPDALPQAPAYVSGMINLRGTVIPIIDLGHRLGLPPIAPGASSIIVLVEVHGQPAGLLVDAVSDLITVSTDKLQTVPEMGNSVDLAPFVRGVMVTETGILSLVCVENVIPFTVAMTS